MDDEWRQFQDLVAEIEEHLAPKGAVVVSPDCLPDLVTGQKREVDASIRMKVGSAEVLITLECRCRARKQDVTWIEQLATKRESIGAAKTIAVSSTGFSEAAKQAARMKGIELRLLQEISDEESAQRFLSGLSVTVELTEWHLLGFTLHADDGRPLGRSDLATSLLEALDRARDLDFPFLRVLAGGKWVSINQLIAAAPQPEIPDSGESVVVHYRRRFRRNTLAVPTPNADEPVSGIDMSVTFRRETKAVDLFSLQQYTGPAGTIIEVLRGDVEISDLAVQLKVLMHRDTAARGRGRDNGV